MIDELRCDGCGKKLGENLQGRLEVVCPRCHRYSVYDTIGKKKKVSVIQKGRKDA